MDGSSPNLEGRPTKRANYLKITLICCLSHNTPDPKGATTRNKGLRFCANLLRCSALMEMTRP